MSQRPEYEVEAFKQVEQNTDQIFFLFQQFISNLSELSNAYIQYQMDTTDNTNYNKFNNLKSIVQNAIDGMQSLSYQIQTDNMVFNGELYKIKELIKVEETKQTEMTEKYRFIQPLDNTSSLLIEDATDEYKSQYLSNWIMFIGIIIIIISLVKVFKK